MDKQERTKRIIRHMQTLPEVKDWYGEYVLLKALLTMDLFGPGISDPFCKAVSEHIDSCMIAERMDELFQEGLHLIDQKINDFSKASAL